MLSDTTGINLAPYNPLNWWERQCLSFAVWMNEPPAGMDWVVAFAVLSVLLLAVKGCAG